MDESNSLHFHNPMKITRQAILIISLCSAFLFYKYVLQSFPSIMAPQLMHTFNLQGLGLGVLSGVYFWTYLIVPLFVGLILDYYGTRWATGLAILCSAIGVFLFAFAHSIHSAIWARALMGVGVSFASIAYFKLAAVWFDKKYFALLTSLLVTAGMIGAVFGQMPLAWLVKWVDWRNSLKVLGWIGFILAFLFVIFVRDKSSSIPKSSSVKPSNSLSQDILNILKNKQNWLLTGYSGLAFSPIVIFCGLWGNPFLQKAYHLDAIDGPTLVSMVFIGVAIGCPVFALIAEKIQNRRALMAISTFISACCISLVICAFSLPIFLIGLLLFLFGFSLGAFPLVFVIGKELNPLHLAGTATSLINASDALLDAITEPLIGKFLDISGPLTTHTDYSIFTYQLALLILPAYQFIAVALLYWVKDEHKGKH